MIKVHMNKNMFCCILEHEKKAWMTKV